MNSPKSLKSTDSKTSASKSIRSRNQLGPRSLRFEDEEIDSDKFKKTNEKVVIRIDLTKSNFKNSNNPTEEYSSEDESSLDESYKFSNDMDIIHSSNASDLGLEDME